MYETALSIVLLMKASTAQEQCRSVALQKPRTGYRCITENYTTITQVPQHLCTHVCMQKKNCSLINCTLEKTYCQISFEGCQKMVVDPEFTVSAASFPPVCLLITESMHSMGFRCKRPERQEYSMWTPHSLQSWQAGTPN